MCVAGRKRVCEDGDKEDEDGKRNRIRELTWASSPGMESPSWSVSDNARSALRLLRLVTASVAVLGVADTVKARSADCVDKISSLGARSAALSGTVTSFVPLLIKLDERSVLACCPA